MTYYDVIRVNISTMHVDVLTRKLQKSVAEGYATLAIVRQGVEDYFFVLTLSGKYVSGDPYKYDGLPV